MFTSVFRASGGAKLVDLLVASLDLQPVGMMAMFLAIIFILGFILDWVSIVLITIPIFAPIVKSAGIDPLWFAVMVVVVIQTSYLTPPMAPAIFYLRAVAPPEMTYRDMYWGIAPFVLCQTASLLLVALWPAAATYLPSVLVGF
jgi:TRAP-type mannitol/chloroaromatic compound transport system permease large subunit